MARFNGIRRLLHIHHGANIERTDANGITIAGILMS